MFGHLKMYLSPQKFTNFIAIATHLDCFYIIVAATIAIGT